jgi:type VI secretion system secreted protein Hcp
MAFDAFLIFDAGPTPVQGESQDPAFKNAIELKSFAFGAENTISLGSATGGAGAGKARFNELTITKLSDSTSATLFQMLVTGGHFKSATLSIRKSGDKTKPGGGVYERFTFSMVFVSKISINGSSGDDTPTETVVLNYGALKWEYSRQDPTGNLTPVPPTQWSVITNSPTMPS